MLGTGSGISWFTSWCGVSFALFRGIVEASPIVPPGRASYEIGPAYGQQHRHTALRRHASEHRQALSQVQLDGAGQAAPFWDMLVDPLEHFGDEPIFDVSDLNKKFNKSRQRPGQNGQEQNTTHDLFAIFPHVAHGSLNAQPQQLLLGFPDRGSAKRPASHSIKILLGFFGLAYAVVVFIPWVSQSGVPGGQALLSRTPQLEAPRITTRNPAEATWQRLRRQESSPWFSGASSRAIYAAFCSHGMYMGAQSTTWLPFLLLMECEMLWPDHQVLLVGLAGLAYGVGAAFSPVASALINLAVRHWGQAGCRLALRTGVMMSAMSMVACCFTAAKGQAVLFILGILCWSLGDVIVRATLDVFCSKLLGVENCQELYELRLSSVLVGGLLGCMLIIFTVCLQHYWLYFAYLSGLLVTAFCVLIALDTERINSRTEGVANNVMKVGRRPWISWKDELVQAYSSPFLLRSGFPRVCLAYVLFGVASAPMVCMLLFVRDLTFSGSSGVQMQTIKAIFGLSSLFGVLNGFGSCPGGAYGFVHFVWVDTLPRNTSFASTQLMAFSGLLMLPPFIGSFGDDVVSQLMCYAVSACLGAAFGSIHRTFLECLPRLIPSGADKLQVSVFYDMCKQLGTGLGLAQAGYVITYGFQGSSGHLGHVQPMVFPRTAYFEMCTFSALFAVTSALCMLSVPAVVSEEQRALEAADECFEATAGLPAPRTGAGQAERQPGHLPHLGENEDVYTISAAAATTDTVMMVRSASGNNLLYV